MILNGILNLSGVSLIDKMDFTTIYKNYYDTVYRVCLTFLNDAEKAKDLTQESFISVLQNLESFREEAAISTWIYRIATNKCLRSIKKEKKQKKMKENIQIEALCNTDKDSEEKDKKLAFLRQCIFKLAEVDRIIITLFMEGLTQEKIAEINGLSHSNVRVRVHRIKEKLLKEFEHYGKF